jgi:hypothetical protein
MSSRIRTKFRSWVTPITVIVFLLLAETGLLVNLDHSGMHKLHESFGYAFCLISVLHIALNWHPLLSHLRTTKAFVMAVIVTILASLIWISAINNKEHHERASEPRAVHTAY